MFFSRPLLIGSAPVAVALQYARPTSDAAAGTWTPSSGTDLFAMLSEEVRSDASYIKTAAASVARMKLGTIQTPDTGAVSLTYTVYGDGTNTVKVRLMQGTTTINEWTHAAAAASWVEYTQTVTRASVSNWGDLYLEVEAA